MIMTKGAEIVSKFISALNSRNGISVSRTHISRNVFEYCYSAHSKILLYVKGRAQEPYRWGVTANVIQRLRNESKPWVVIMLFESQEQGYLLTSKDISYYIVNKIWPLGADGDYKPATGSYLANNSPLYSVEDFANKIESINTV